MGKEVSSLLALLQEENSLKAWSLIITFFGDAVVARGGNVSAKTVQSVLSAMGVGSGAVRTAFSRLVSDEWIVRNKIGRESFYDLAEDGYRPFQAASARIYSPVNNSDPLTSHSTIVVKDSSVKVINSDLFRKGVQVSANCWLFNGLDNSDSRLLQERDFLVLSGEIQQLPDWLYRKLIPEDLQLGFRQLQHRFATINRVEQLSPIDSLAIRCLLIHQWRRLLLRAPILPPELMPVDWPELKYRGYVADLYHRLVPRSEAWLDEYATCASGKMPAAKHDIALRFVEHFT